MILQLIVYSANKKEIESIDYNDNENKNDNSIAFYPMKMLYNKNTYIIDSFLKKRVFFYSCEVLWSRFFLIHTV